MKLQDIEGFNNRLENIKFSELRDEEIREALNELHQRLTDIRLLIKSPRKLK